MKKILKIMLIIILLSIVYAYALVITNLPDTLIVFEGENIIETENFTPGEGSIKIMIWDSMGNMSPLCGSEIF